MFPILLSVVVISFSGVMMPGPMFAVTVAKSYRTAWTGAQISLGHAVFVSILVHRTRALWGRKFQPGLFISCSLLLIGFGDWFLISGLQVVV